MYNANFLNVHYVLITISKSNSKIMSERSHTLVYLGSSNPDSFNTYFVECELKALSKLTGCLCTNHSTKIYGAFVPFVGRAKRGTVFSAGL